MKKFKNNSEENIQTNPQDELLIDLENLEGNFQSDDANNDSRESSKNQNESEEGSQNNSQNNFTAKKSLGQNFLHAPNVISAMIHAGKISKDNIVLEVGPGKGALTIKLLETGVKVIAVEKDDRAIPFLQEKFANEIKSGQLELVHGDILDLNIDNPKNSDNLSKIDSSKFDNHIPNNIINDSNNGFSPEKLTNYILIANIPYYITGQFMRKFLETSNQPIRIVVMLQKEVARRITDTKESILSLSVKAYGEPKYLVTVPKKFFRPMPNVDSAVLVIENISKKFFIDSKIDEKYFFEVIKTAFAHKRKVVIKNLEDKIPKETLNKIWERENISHNARAEDLSPEMWKKIIGNN